MNSSVDQNPGGFAAGFFVLQTRRSKLRSFEKQKTHENSWVLILSGGERGIVLTSFGHRWGPISKKQMPGLRPSSFFIAVALENKFSTLHQRKMPHKGAFDFLAEREGFEPPDL